MFVNWSESVAVSTDYISSQFFSFVAEKVKSLERDAQMWQLYDLDHSNQDFTELIKTFPNYKTFCFNFFTASATF